MPKREKNSRANPYMASTTLSPIKSEAIITHFLNGSTVKAASDDEEVTTRTVQKYYDLTTIRLFEIGLLKPDLNEHLPNTIGEITKHYEKLWYSRPGIHRSNREGAYYWKINTLINRLAEYLSVAERRYTKGEITLRDHIALNWMFKDNIEAIRISGPLNRKSSEDQLVAAYTYEASTHLRRWLPFKDKSEMAAVYKSTAQHIKSRMLINSELEALEAKYPITYGVWRKTAPSKEIAQLIDGELLLILGH